MRIFKTLAALALSFAFLAGLNVALTYALVPYGSKSELAWTDYARQNEIDTVIVGASLAQNAVNPLVLDELCGFNSFSLATPNQSLEESLVAIQTAYEDHGIERAILGVSLADVQAAADPPSLGSAFLSNRSRVVTPAQNAEAASQILLRYGGIAQSGSVNALFPWFYNHVTLNPSSVTDNVRARLEKTVYEAAETTDSDGHYAGKGYYVYDAVLDYDGDQTLPFFSEEREDGATETDVDEGRLRVLEDISSYCSEKGIELIAVSVPLPAYDVLDGDSYYALHDNVVQAFAALGRDYHDFNFARPELFEPQPDYFLDTIHMNAEGSRVFTESLSRLIGKIDAGESVDGFFCGADEQRASVDYISAVFAESRVDAGGIHVEARAVTGSDVSAEFQLCVLNAGTQAWDVVSGWSESSAFDYVPADKGLVNLQVRSRIAGAQSDGDRFRNLNVYY